jgi:hypothetical protein
MTRTSEFYSIHEVKKLPENRVHHNNNECPPGRDIPENERRDGKAGHRLCDVCKKLNAEGK